MLLMLSGAIGSGKDTLAEMLLDHFDRFGFHAELVKFADPIREVAFALGFNPDDRKTKEVPARRDYELSALSDTIFKVFSLLPPYERRMVAVKVHQRLIQTRKEKHDGIYKPVVSTREFMQILGGEVRNADQDYYLKAMVANCPVGRINVCSDCRFVNEQAIGDFKVYVVRPDNPLAVNTLDQSEAAQALLQQNADKILVNSKDLAELDEQAAIIATTLILKGKCDDAVKDTSGTGSIMC